MSARTTRTRVLAAAALAVATLTLTACNNGEGVRDEGASAGATSQPSSTPTSGSQKNKETTTDAGQAGSSSDSDSNSKPKDGKGTQNSSGSTGSSDASKSSDSQDPGPTRTPCTAANTRMTATVVARPLNHLLLTVTNTGSKNCNVIGYPAVRFGEAQSVPPVMEESQPQAVVTLAPGESGYAGVRLSAADGSGSNGYTAKSLSLYLKDSAAASKPSLPAKGVYVDDSIAVTYWQQTMADALTW
ncbi:MULTISPECIES: DUF4232 domain-containing protein [unclassified Streptomyces]|uniref:DUF4232 domain-containing protein n=1 Tax=unclassified Streptomyces TaxID=2593676 RepID=UPI003655A11B